MTGIELLLGLPVYIKVIIGLAVGLGVMLEVVARLWIKRFGEPK